MRGAIPIACGLLFCAAYVASIGRTEFPGIFDELEHISYAARLQETGSVLPRLTPPDLAPVSVEELTVETTSLPGTEH
jgi:hypothetical protein